jgi:hypothetical protein
MAKMFGLTAIYSDGSDAADAVLTYYPNDPDTDKPYLPSDGVWIKIRPISQQRFNEAERRCTGKVKDQFARRMVEDPNYIRLTDELMQWAIIDWSGIAARNAVTGTWELFPFSEEKKTSLPGSTKNDLLKFAMEPQSAEVTTESFRSTP